VYQKLYKGVVIMKGTLNTTSLRASDALITKASKLPHNLVVDGLNEHGMFSLAFLMRLTEDQLCDLRREARIQENDDIFLFFYSIPKKDFRKKGARELKNFTTFDFSTVEKIHFNGNCCPILDYPYSNASHYVSVTFVLKDED